MSSRSVSSFVPTPTSVLQVVSVTLHGYSGKIHAFFYNTANFKACGAFVRIYDVFSQCGENKEIKIGKNQCILA